MEQEQIQVRKERGRQIAQTSRIRRNEKGAWQVPSQSGRGHYTVTNNGNETTCTCPDCETRRCKCKHIWAVEYIVMEETDNEGNIRITAVRKTYKQDWSNYDKATTNQKLLFMKLLGDITSQIPQPEYKFGRPTLPVSDMIYNSVMKVYTTYSLRRFMSDMAIAQEKGYIKTKPCYASVGHFLQRKDITPILANMVTLTSLPLRTVEQDFSIDSTGFGTSVFQRWFNFRHGREISSRRWVKCHFINGVKTNIVTGVKVTTEFDNDCPQLPEMVQATAQNFDMREVSADKAYLSRDNMDIVAEQGATPFIPFKSNSKARNNGAVWKRMYYYFMLNNEDFLEHYHKRSNAESTVQMIKSKFGDSVKSKDWQAQVNEVLCKIICHNICVVIQEMHELGIKPLFCVESQASV